ncbi:hypothetical protein NDU88_001251 [Pleurodeles waltl]|uniref:Uncharacterized protein n=1 Tax=Pleurodeles waltl TaxID=8319 RepID=A0AAV7NBV6_PLEWA|nr:hypothetical protein NDU88_001251 [Pleurodeles waltl]
MRSPGPHGRCAHQRLCPQLSAVLFRLLRGSQIGTGTALPRALATASIAVFTHLGAGGHERSTPHSRAEKPDGFSKFF